MYPQMQRLPRGYFRISLQVYANFFSAGAHSQKVGTIIENLHSGKPMSAWG
jgi:hypothetical protein